MKRNKIAVKWGIFMWLILFVFFIIILLWVMQVTLLDKFYKNTKMKDIEITAKEIEKRFAETEGDIFEERGLNKFVSPGGEPISSINSGLREYVRRLSLSQDVSVMITDISGSQRLIPDARPGYLFMRMGEPEDNMITAYIQNAVASGGSWSGTFNEFKQIIGNRDGSAIQFSENSVSDSILYVKMITDKAGTERVLFINTRILPVDSTTQTIRSQLLFITLVLILAALLIALVISRWMSVPLARINSASKELAKGDYSVEFAQSGYREISELGETLNYAKDELSKTAKLQRELVANISHDLRTPLTMISGYAEAMRDLPGENNNENIQIIIDESKRLSDLVSDVLDLSKIKSGTRELNISRFNLTELIRTAMKRFSGVINKEGYIIEFENDCDVMVELDELRISQVIYNLLINAITYTGDGEDKKVLIRQTLQERNKVLIEVRDYGEGIPKDKIEQIWDRYYKIEGKHKRAVKGTGIGLSIVKEIFELHRLDYGVNGMEEKGSTFRFVCPFINTL